MDKIFKAAFFLIFCFLLNSCCRQEPKLNNIILMIGDGMGTAQVYAGYTINKGHLNLERSSYIGLSKTSAADNYITDSGAGGTAISTGKKVKNQSIAVGEDDLPLKTIIESAEDHGLATGLIATSAITHATPASFIAHNTSRYNYEEIATDFLGSGIDLFIGGGRNHFEFRSDSLNLSDSLRKEGYAVVYSLGEVDVNTDQKTACFVADMHPSSVLKGRGDYLPKATEKALEKLSLNKEGFFIMIEGSQIDWGGHDKDTDYVCAEMQDFDAAVGKAFDFADQHPGTLVIVTADHETGGMSLGEGNIAEGQVTAHFSTDHHTAVMVPVFAYGTGAAEFAGVYENTELYHKMMKLLGL